MSTGAVEGARGVVVEVAVGVGSPSEEVAGGREVYLCLAGRVRL